ncbi:aa3-type cytochrome c oxidase subunit IV [Paracoccus fistulariae]|uniref:Aa3-type cytochrome c oxidase subunit IV n=1 Tax=Paracoccus fistulariae TaxID=658446 RepID=A0ABY7SHW9_9RHOB|nr:aa3-type cytochrome c oxidase subunit IV [Paracoccus fistulariae]MDB6182179.1 aa3-type cytochrome c oxidase subunit IV [Paracoccus fistulariae]WCR06598.1 aa3-type cytochrome c oxidase subunit IV [Paracoccus fistulariae]
MASHDEVTDYKPGEMDITEQRKTFSGFLKAVNWVCMASIVALIFLALVNS